MMQRSLLPLAAILLAGSAIASDDIRTETLRFDGNTAIIEDQIKGYETVDFAFEAKAGQPANISMATKHLANYFNILPPGSNDVAIYVGSINGNQFEGVLDEAGQYKIRVYLMRSAARRGESADFRLEVILSENQ